MNHVLAILLALVSAIATGAQDVVILALLFASLTERVRRRNYHLSITWGYLLGSSLVLLISALAGYTLTRVPNRGMLAWLGLIPMLLGLRTLARPEGRNNAVERTASILNQTGNRSLFVQSTLLALVLGIDDFGIYIPLFSSQTAADSLLILAVSFIALVASVFFSQRARDIDTLTAALNRTERWLTPALYLIIGAYVLLSGRIGF